MDYQIIVISKMHHDASGNVVKEFSPLNIDSFDVTQKILLLGPPKLLTCHQGSQHYKGWEPLEYGNLMYRK